MPSTLDGLRVLVTRPRVQGQLLAERIEQQGGTAICVPTLEIVPLSTDVDAAHTRAHLSTCDLIIFVSPHAVAYADQLIGLASFLADTRAELIAPGAGTARALYECGASEVLVPEGAHDSEALLRLPQLADARVQGKRCCLVRGTTGRGLLASTLCSRGAVLMDLPLYQRCLPPSCAAQLKEACERKLDVVLVSSGDGLANMIAAAGSAQVLDVLRELPLLVPSPRVANMARAENFSQVSSSYALGADGTLQRLLEWAEHR